MHFKKGLILSSPKNKKIVLYKFQKKFSEVKFFARQEHLFVINEDMNLNAFYKIRPYKKSEIFFRH